MLRVGCSRSTGTKGPLSRYQRLANLMGPWRQARRRRNGRWRLEAGELSAFTEALRFTVESSRRRRRPINFLTWIVRVLDIVPGAVGSAWLFTNLRDTRVSGLNLHSLPVAEVAAVVVRLGATAVNMIFLPPHVGSPFTRTSTTASAMSALCPVALEAERRAARAAHGWS